MRKLLLLLFIPSLCFGQMTRAEVMSKLNEWRSYEIERIQEIGSSRIITNNQIGDNISMINNGIYPYSETIYFFSGNEINSKLESVSTIYSHPDRSVISLYSNENQLTNEYFQPYIFSNSRSISRGPVEFDSKTGRYFTRETNFNLK